MINLNNKQFYVHHIMAWTFLYKDIKAFDLVFPGQKYEINHRDNNNKNNNINNLFICNIEINRLNKRKYTGKNIKNKYKGVYLVNNKKIEIERDDIKDINDNKTVYKIVFKGKFVDHCEDQEEGANIYDNMLISYIHSKYGSLDLLNTNVLNNNDNLTKFKNKEIDNQYNKLFEDF